MSSYLVESFLPRDRAADLTDLVEATRTACHRLSLDGVSVSHVRSTYVPDDEVWLLFFEASSEAAVARALEAAQVTHDRIVETRDSGAQGEAGS